MKKQYQNTFLQGLSMDQSKYVSSNQSYYYSMNGTLMEDGDNMIFQNMTGNELKAMLPKGYVVKAVTVFNGIAYIVSQKYEIIINEDDSDELGCYEYTELGTYPSPKWGEILSTILTVNDTPINGEDVPLSVEHTVVADESFAAIKTDGFEFVYTIKFPTVEWELQPFNFLPSDSDWSSSVSQQKNPEGLNAKYSNRLQRCFCNNVSQGRTPQNTSPSFVPFYDALPGPQDSRLMFKDWNDYSSDVIIDLILGPLPGYPFYNTYHNVSTFLQTFYNIAGDFIYDSDEKLNAEYRCIQIINYIQNLSYDDNKNRDIYLVFKSNKFFKPPKKIGVSYDFDIKYYDSEIFGIPVVAETYPYSGYHASYDAEIDLTGEWLRNDSSIGGFNYSDDLTKYKNGFIELYSNNINIKSFYVDAKMHFARFKQSFLTEYNPPECELGLTTVLEPYVLKIRTPSVTKGKLLDDTLLISKNHAWRYNASTNEFYQETSNSVWHQDINNNFYMVDDSDKDFTILKFSEEVDFYTFEGLSITDFDQTANEIIDDYGRIPGLCILSHDGTNWIPNVGNKEGLFSKSCINIAENLADQIDKNIFYELFLTETLYDDNDSFILEHEIDNVTGIVLQRMSCVPSGTSTEFNPVFNFDDFDCQVEGGNRYRDIHFWIRIENTDSVSQVFQISNPFIATGGETVTIEGNSYQDVLVSLYSVPEGDVDPNIINISFVITSNSEVFSFTDVSFHVNSQFEAIGYYVNVCSIPLTSGMVECYSPLYNFNKLETDEALLSDAALYQDPFQSREFVNDSKTDIELELQPNYDNSVNMIINDKNTKIKLVNSRFVYNPIDNTASIPQSSGFRLSNVYSEKHLNKTELIPRFTERATINLKEIVNGGELVVGKYFYSFRYLDTDGNKTDIVNTLNNGVPAYVKKNEFSYGETDGENTNISHALVIEGFDKKFSNVELSFAFISGKDSKLVKFYILDKNYQIPNSGSLNITVTGLESKYEISAEEFSKVYNHHLSISSISQNSSRLVLGNIKLSDVLVYDYIQKLFIEKCSIKETYITVASSAEKSFYASGVSDAYYTGYWRGETYQLGVKLGLIMGGESPVFNPKGIDNYKGNINNTPGNNDGYSGSAISNGFSSNYGENPYGVYRTKASSSIQYEDNSVIVSLYIDGLEDVLQDPIVKSIFNSFAVVRKERIKDCIIQGYTSPSYKIGKDMGNLLSTSSESPTVSNSPNMFPLTSSDFNTDTSDSQNLGIAENIDQYGSYFPAPFGLVQTYEGDLSPKFAVNQTVPDNISIKNLKIKHRTDNNNFSFLSADLMAEPEKFAYEFSSHDHSYTLSLSEIKGSIDIDSAFIVKDSNTNKYLFKLKDNIIRNNLFNTGQCGNQYVNEDMRAIVNNKFAARADTCDLNIKYGSYIGAKQKFDDDMAILLNKLKGEEAYNTNVYRSDKGSLSNTDWKEVYLSQYNNGGYAQITNFNLIKDVSDVFNIYGNPVTSLSDKSILTEFSSQDSVKLNLFGGDCYINVTPIRVFYPIGLDDVVNPNIRDYVQLGSTNAGADDVVADVVGESDDIHRIINGMGKEQVMRARLVPKGMWINLVHESNYNIAFRSNEFKSTQERALFGQDRGFYNTIDAQNELSSKQLETKELNKGYFTSINPINSFTQYNFDKILRLFYTRIEASSKSVKGQLSNGYRDIFGIDYQDYDTSFGKIMKLISNHNKLYCLQEKAVSIIPLDDKYALSEENGGVYVSQNQVLYPELSVLSNTIGCINPDSAIGVSTGVYFYDHNSVNICKIADQGIEVISKYKIQSFLKLFNKRLDELQIDKENYPDGVWFNVKTNYDELSGNVYFSFIIYKNIIKDCSENENEDFHNYNYDNSNESINDACPLDIDSINGIISNDIISYYTIYFNDRLGKWISPLSWSPKHVFTLSDRTYSINNLYNSNRIYEHDINSNYGFFYEQQHGLMISFVVIGDSGIHKILDNLTIISNNTVPIALSYDVDEDQIIENLVKRNIDSNNICKTRVHEIKVIGLNDETNEANNPDDYYVYSNIDRIEKYIPINDPTVIYNHKGIDFRVTGVDYSTLNRFGFPKLEMEYSNDSGTTWINVEKGNEGYRKVFGLIFKNIEINILNANSDYIEDKLDVQVIRKEDNSDIRDKVFIITLRYDGIDKTVIQNVLSHVRIR